MSGAADPPRGTGSGGAAAQQGAGQQEPQAGPGRDARVEAGVGKTGAGALRAVRSGQGRVSGSLRERRGRGGGARVGRLRALARGRVAPGLRGLRVREGILVLVVAGVLGAVRDRGSVLVARGRDGGGGRGVLERFARRILVGRRTASSGSRGCSTAGAAGTTVASAGFAAGAGSGAGSMAEATGTTERPPVRTRTVAATLPNDTSGSCNRAGRRGAQAASESAAPARAAGYRATRHAQAARDAFLSFPRFVLGVALVAVTIAPLVLGARGDAPAPVGELVGASCAAGRERDRDRGARAHPPAARAGGPAERPPGGARRAARGRGALAGRRRSQASEQPASGPTGRRPAGPARGARSRRARAGRMEHPPASRRGPRHDRRGHGLVPPAPGGEVRPGRLDHARAVLRDGRGHGLLSRHLGAVPRARDALVRQRLPVAVPEPRSGSGCCCSASTAWAGRAGSAPSACSERRWCWPRRSWWRRSPAAPTTTWSAWPCSWRPPRSSRTGAPPGRRERWRRWPLPPRSARSSP